MRKGTSYRASKPAWRMLSALVAALLAALSPGRALAEGVLRTVLVIDASSSMLSTDPKEIRKVAAELFVDLTRDGDQLAVTGFDGGARESMGSFITIRGPADRQSVKSAIRAVGKNGSWTDFTAGLGEARRLLEAAPDQPGDQELVVFLTDGRCDPDPRGPFVEAARATGGGRRLEDICQERVLKDILPALGRTRVYAIGLSKSAPKAFIETIGDQTGGVGLATDRAEELPRLFAEVYARLLGSKLLGGESAPETEFDVSEGVLTVDVMMAGPPSLNVRLRDPAGADIPLDNSEPSKAYFSNSPGYRLIKVGHPAPGRWKLSTTGGAKGGKYAVLQNMDLQFNFVSLPEVFEVGKPRPIRVSLATPGGKVPPAEFLDRHKVTLRAAEAQAKCLDVLRGGSQRGGAPVITVKRGANGIYEMPQTASARGEICFEAMMTPGSSGVLSRLAWSPVRKVIPPIHLKATATPFGEVKQDAKGRARISFEGSEIGEVVEAELIFEESLRDLTISPVTFTLEPGSARAMDVTVSVDRDAKSGPRAIKATALPKKPAGFEDRAVTVDLTITIVPLTFWERYGFWVKVGGGVALALFLLMGLIGPSRFRKGTVLHYKDMRDPDLPREGSYPLAAKAKAGFYRSARVLVGPTGPVRRGGVVELSAGPGGSVVARPLGMRRASELPHERDDEGGISPEKGRDIKLSKQGKFRTAAGSRYAIESTGLTFWVTRS